MPVERCAFFFITDVNKCFVAEFLRKHAIESMLFDVRIVVFGVGALKANVPIAGRTADQERYRSFLVGQVERAVTALR